MNQELNIIKKLLCTGALCAAISGFGQGTFVFDQQSSTDEGTPPYGYGANLNLILPAGQSFTPALSGIDFVRLAMDDASPGDGYGETVYVNLRSQSLTGPIIGTTTSVAMPDGFAGHANFLFENRIGLIPGTEYWLEFVVAAASPAPWDIVNGSYNYTGGIAYANGNPVLAADYWFREGILVPEPGPLLLALLAAAASVLAKARRGCSQ